MIIFDLKCANGHQFEGWFEDCCDFDHQQKQSMISCPMCTTTDVTRIPSTFGIKQSQAARDTSDERLQLEALHQKVIDFVETHFENVGCQFAREALKMHYGVTESRNIRGVSTQAEEKMLTDEGIEFIKIPMPIGSKTES